MRARSLLQCKWVSIATSALYRTQTDRQVISTIINGHQMSTVLCREMWAGANEPNGKLNTTQQCKQIHWVLSYWASWSSHISHVALPVSYYTAVQHISTATNVRTFKSTECKKTRIFSSLKALWDGAENEIIDCAACVCFCPFRQQLIIGYYHWDKSI